MYYIIQYIHVHVHSVPVVDHVLIVCHNTLYKIAVTAEHNIIKNGINCINNDDVIALCTLCVYMYNSNY